MTTPSPEELARSTESQIQTILIDFDFKSPENLVLGADPEDLTNIPTVGVKLVFLPWAVLTIVAHEEEGQEVANLLADKPEIVDIAAHYAELYFKEGVMELSLNALTDEQKRNVERYTGRRMRGEEDE